MNPGNDTNWLEQYRILGLEPGCEWSEVHRAYRRLAQSHHPDRFDESSPEFREASNLIIEINQAYGNLSAYYKSHGHLPGQRYSAPAGARGPVRHAPPRTDWPVEPEKAKKPFIRRPSTILIALGIAIGLNYFWPPNFGMDGTPFDNAEPNRSIDSEASTPDLLGDSPSKSVAETPHFGPGSTMGEVHAIQGNPTRTTGSTWYYGKSRVTFVNGLVYSWYDDPDNPLKVKVDPDINPYARTRHSRLTSRFTYGSTKADVEAIQGPPLTKGKDLWDYGLSQVYFTNDRVVRWVDSPMQPLKVDEDQ